MGSCILALHKKGVLLVHIPEVELDDDDLLEPRPQHRRIPAADQRLLPVLWFLRSFGLHGVSASEMSIVHEGLRGVNVYGVSLQHARGLAWKDKKLLSHPLCHIFRVWAQR